MRANREKIGYWGRTVGVMVLMVAAFASYMGLSQWREDHGFLINATESLPNWAFFIEKNTTPKRGDYVFFTPPKHPLIVRHFGTKTGPFGKIVYGVPGDVVERHDNDVSVNGKVVAALKPFTKSGEPLEPGPTGIIPQGCYFVGTPHKDGFDSRYAAIGYACRGAIFGTGRAIL